MRDNPNIENSIFRSIHSVALDTMPGYKTEGVEHSFLERFDRQEEALERFDRQEEALRAEAAKAAVPDAEQ